MKKPSDKEIVDWMLSRTYDGGCSYGPNTFQHSVGFTPLEMPENMKPPFTEAKLRAGIVAAMSKKSPPRGEGR